MLLVCQISVLCRHPFLVGGIGDMSCGLFVFLCKVALEVSAMEGTLIDTMWTKLTAFRLYHWESYVGFLHLTG